MILCSFIYYGEDESKDCNRGCWVSQKVFPIYYGVSVIFCLASSWVDDGSDTKSNYKDMHSNHDPTGRTAHSM